VSNSANIDFIFLEKSIRNFEKTYFQTFGDSADLARTHSGFYQPRCAVFAEPNTEFVSNIRALASDIIGPLTTIYRKSFSGTNLAGNAGAIARAIPPKYRHDVLTHVRLDVVATLDGLRIIEVNTGNCGGSCMYGIMEGFLTEQYGAQITDFNSLTYRLDSLHTNTDASHLECLYIGESARLFAIARAKRILKRRPDMSHNITRLGNFKPDGARQGTYYLDFLLEGNTRSSRTSEILSFFSGKNNLYSVSPISDHFMSDKVYIANAAKSLPTDEAARWNKWVAPTRVIDGQEAPLTTHTTDEIHGRVIVKPADGYSGNGIYTFDSIADIPDYTSLGEGGKWVVQPFYETLTASTPIGANIPKLNTVFGVFLVREGNQLRYAGTNVRYSTDAIVNLGTCSELGIVLEPEWGVDTSKMKRESRALSIVLRHARHRAEHAR
jgi:hypothetical protein